MKPKYNEFNKIIIDIFFIILSLSLILITLEYKKQSKYKNQNYVDYTYTERKFVKLLIYKCSSIIVKDEEDK